jgi:hypothetical protein
LGRRQVALLLGPLVVPLVLGLVFELLVVEGFGRLHLVPFEFFLSLRRVAVDGQGFFERFGRVGRLAIVAIGPGPRFGISGRFLLRALVDGVDPGRFLLLGRSSERLDFLGRPRRTLLRLVASRRFIGDRTIGPTGGIFLLEGPRPRRGRDLGRFSHEVVGADRARRLAGRFDADELAGPDLNPGRLGEIGDSPDLPHPPLAASGPRALRDLAWLRLLVGPFGRVRGVRVEVGAIGLSSRSCRSKGFRRSRLLGRLAALGASWRGVEKPRHQEKVRGHEPPRDPLSDRPTGPRHERGQYRH